MNKRTSQNASNPNHQVTEDSVPNTKLHRRLIENLQQGTLGDTDNSRSDLPKLASIPEVRIATPSQAKVPQTIAQNVDGDTSQFQFLGPVDPNTAVMQLALSNLLGGLQNQTPQQPIATTISTPANVNLYLQLLQLHQQQQQQQQQRDIATSIGGLNPLSQALWAAIVSQQQPNMLSEYSSETDASGRYTSGTTEGLSGSSMSDKQGRLLVPCRARGMSVEHNFQTAYFEISPDIKHGDGLICSFPACRNRGVKFLYCAYCKDPVAKRNFRNQHSHADGAEGTIAAAQPSIQQTSHVASATGKQHDHKEATTEPSSELSMSKKRKMSTTQDVTEDDPLPTSSSGLKIGPASGNSSSSEGDKSTSEHSDENDEISKKIASIDMARRSAWERLLVSRPSTDDNEVLAAWLVRVMAVSDLKKPFRSEDEESS